MSTMQNRLMQNLRQILHLTTVEQDVASIKKDIEDQELRTGAGQALLANQQQQLEVAITELFGAILDLHTSIANERSRKNESDLQFAEAIAQLSNEIKRLGDIVDENTRSITLRQSDNDSQL